MRAGQEQARSAKDDYLEGLRVCDLTGLSCLADVCSPWLSLSLRAQSTDATGEEAPKEETRRESGCWNAIHFRWTPSPHTSPVFFLPLATVRKFDPLMRQNLTDFGRYVAECMPKYVQRVQLTAGDELEVLIAPEGVHTVISFLKNHHNCQFASLADICGVDMPTREFRFEASRAGWQKGTDSLRSFFVACEMFSFASFFLDRVQPPVSPLQLPHPRQDIHGRADSARVCVRHLRRRQLVRAGDLRHVRSLLCQPPRSAADPHRLRIRGAPAQEGFPPLRILGGRKNKLEIFTTVFQP